MSNFEVDTIDDLGNDALLLSMHPKTQADCFGYQAGQYVSVGFERFGRKTPVRCFSIVSSPNQQDLQVAMRVRGNFTKAANEIQPGDTVFVQGPFGNFVLDALRDKAVVFIAAGIGITPFISMLRTIRDSGLQTRVVLLYRVGRNNTVLFKNELLRLQTEIPQFKVIFFVGEQAQSQAIANATVLPESITESRLSQLVNGQFGNITYFMCGPKGFMNGIEQVLLRHEVPPDRIMTESFAQSTPKSSSWSVSRLTYAFAALLVVAGIGGIMTLDLARQIPSQLAASSQASTTQTTSEDTGTTDEDTNTSDAVPATNTGTTSSQGTTSVTQPTTNAGSSTNTTDSTTSTQAQPTYTQPVSRQS